MTTPDFNRRVAAIIASRNGQPISAAAICELVGIAPNETNKRKIRYAVNQLVTIDGLPIASCQTGQAGYRLCISAADRINGAKPLISQAAEMFRRANRLVDKHTIRQLLGQCGFEFEEAA